MTDKNDPKYWEHYFAKEIDTLCGQDMDNIIAKATLSRPNTLILSAHDKEVLSKLIIAQLMRIPDSIDYVKTVLYPRVSAQVKKYLVSTLPPAFVEKYKEQIMNTEFSEQGQKELVLNYSFEPINFGRYCKVVYSENGSKVDEIGRFDWVASTVYSYKDDLPFGHGRKSMYIALGFFGDSMPPSVASAIDAHMHDIDVNPNVGLQMMQQPLGLWLHIGDAIAAHIVEAGK